MVFIDSSESENPPVVKLAGKRLATKDSLTLGQLVKKCIHAYIVMTYILKSRGV